MAEHELLLPAGHRRYSKSQSKRVRTPEGYSQRTAKGRARPCCLPESGVGVEGGGGGCMSLVHLAQDTSANVLYTR